MGKVVRDILKIVGSREKIAPKIAISIVLFFILYFSFVAVTTTPQQINELDSLGQHIPLAESIAKGNLFNPPRLANGLGYYMPIGEIILSIFIKLGVPLGFYNVLSLILLFIIAYKLGVRFGMFGCMSVVFAFSLVSINSVLRLVPTQKNDIWLAIFFLWSLYLLKKPKKEIKYFLSLGTSLGLLIGVKYSGVLYALILAVLFYKDLKKKLSFEKVLIVLLPIILFGGAWYLRNYILTGNPFYPVSILGFNGHPGFIVPRGYNTLFSARTSLMTIEAFMSEYLIWSILPLVFIYLILRKKYRSLISSDLYKLLIISLFSFLVYLVLPSEYTRTNITSNLRFLYPVMFPLVLSAFIFARRHGLALIVAIISILSSVSVLSQFNYRPKLIFIWLLLVIIFVNYDYLSKRLLKQ